MAIEPGGGGALQRQQETSSLADVVGTILDKGVVVDIFARVSLVGIELLRVDARVVIASVDTYLRFAEAANRLELATREPEQLPDVASELTGAGARSGASRIAESKAKGFLDNILSPSDEDEKAGSRDD